ncbi:MAG: AMP-dependent synthetase/ligase [Candidatus Nanopelagicales bacterium]|nr:AMP-dependent synthetase/ligase [Candidatus Nanopelagicales bacterium]MDP4907710.1 AMP-dependent synthetase/ligase [Candidatus Nanopelagicales bacterium]MDP4975703.1 AMP-dependent synthetase/ligase [Candidatus Nanopelagicales bacterium]MDP5094715.1 AMP-dependent synthetase/ligase [Candidatus Nanopelagicales bacterium]
MKTEFSVAAIVPPPTSGSLVDAIVDNAQSTPHHIALSINRGGAWVGVTSQQFLDQVKSVAKGIVASGVEPGQRVGIMSRTRYDWTVADYAIWYAGATVVPIYETSSAEQVEWILGDSNAVGVFLESTKNKKVFDEVSDRIPDCTRAWIFDDGALDTLAAAGAGVSDEELEKRRATLNPESLATIIYTSGTTGRPKGCMLTHGNFMFEVDNIVAGMPELFKVQGASTLLFLPLAHVFGRIIQLGCIRSGTRLGHAPDVKNLLPDMQSFQPTFLLAVPRVFEKVHNSAQQKAAADGKGNIFNAAAQTAIDYSKSLDTGGPGLVLKVKHKVFDKLVYSKLRAAMGGKVAWAVSGGAPLGDRLGHFFRGIGVIILEGYGLTETSAATTVNRPDALKIGTVGQPFPGASVKVAPDGELMLAGAQIFKGYWNNPTATAEAIEPDGWFHSGDIGEIDDQGFVKITGRKKELIVTAGGKNVAPAVLEDRLRSNWLVSQCLVVGDAQPFIAALVTIDPESFPAWLKQKGKPATTTIASMTSDPDLIAEIQGAVNDANKAVSNAEAIKKFTILPEDWTEEGGQLTPSMKLKRNVVMKEYSSEVDALYA